MFANKYNYADHTQSDDDDEYHHEDHLAINSPPSGLITLSPNTPILHFNPFGYNTFGAGHPDGDDEYEDICNNHEPEYSQTSSKQTLNHLNNLKNDDKDRSDPIIIPQNVHKNKSYINHTNTNPYYFNHEEEEEEDYSSGDDDDELYTKIGIKYRQFCFSQTGVRFTIILNILMVLINTSLIIYEIVLMIKTHSFTTYYDLRLPVIYSVCDIILTLVLLIEISLHLTAIYKCHICNYFKYNHHHKMDILVFLLSLLLCILYIFDVFHTSDMDNISFLFLRIIRDIMRFVRCIIFAKFLYDSIVQLQTPQKKTRRRHRLDHQSSTSCSSGWDHLKTDKQTQFVCL